MRGWLLHTNVASEARKPNADARVAAWVAAQPAGRLFLSTTALAEIRFGVGLLPPGSPHRTELEAWVGGPLRRCFEHRIPEVTENVLLVWRRMVQATRARGHTAPDPDPDPDCLLAATAAVNDLRVATRNVRDFARIGVPVLNPWDPPP